MQYDLFNKIVADLHSNHEVKKICPYLCNEPCIDPTLELRLEILSAAFPNAEVELSTNMLLCNRDRAERTLNILGNHPGDCEIWISHHGVDEKSFKKIMGLNYEKTLENIIDLIQLNDGRVFIKIRGLGSSRDGKVSFFTSKEYIKYWSDIFSKHKLDVGKVEIDAYGSFHSRAGNVSLDGWDYDTKLREIGPGHPFNCWRVGTTLHVDFEGLVIPCCCDYNRRYILGDLKTQTVQEVVDSEPYQTFVKKARGEIESEDGFICKQCMSVGG